jgi:hypothetical protein
VAWILALCIGNWLGWHLKYTCRRRVHARFTHAENSGGLMKVVRHLFLFRGSQERVQVH